MSAAADSLLGRRFGSIRIDAKLGAGAMGVVYRGVHEILKKEVAVKVLGPNAHKAHARERFLREAQAAAKVSHANVVQVFEAGEAAGQTYLVMELVNGHSLGSILDEIARRAGGKKAGMPAETVARLGVGISLGLAAIHAQGIVHRDIKPDNILVAGDQSPKIADLGLAKQMTDPDLLRLTGTGMVVGTPLYVAPEAIRDPETISPASDIYSLGATLYHMLTGVPPFDSATAYEVMRAHLEDRPKPIRDRAAAVPAGLAQLVEQCLEKDPRRRPSALALAELLGRGTGLKAKPNRGIVLLVTAAVLAVGGGAAATWWFLRPAAGAGAVRTPDGVLTVQSSYPDLRLRVGSGPWQDARPEGLPLPPGRHEVLVEARLPGPALRQAFTVDLAPAELKRLSADQLAPVVLGAEVLLEMPGAGLLLLNGQTHSLNDGSAAVTNAGQWHLARWDGGRLRTRTYEVDHLGRARQLGKDGESDRLAGDACWRRTDADGMPCRPHHVVSWWMANELGRKAAPLLPADWAEQGSRPTQPAIRLNAPLVAAVVERLSGAGLPDYPTARDLMQRLRLKAVWYRNEQGKPQVGAGIDALVLVPAGPGH